jgi:hypothetical protein
MSELAAKRSCCVCERPFTPTRDRGVASLIYCSASCAWNTDASRSRESRERELAALTWALGLG